MSRPRARERVVNEWAITGLDPVEEGLEPCPNRFCLSDHNAAEDSRSCAAKRCR